MSLEDASDGALRTWRSSSLAADVESVFCLEVLACMLGYFIDVFDIQLYAVLRVTSLKDVGVSNDLLSSIGGAILNAQMLGMLLGAFFWGYAGDRFGRLHALYGSILIYSLATFGCAFVEGPTSYGVLRFAAGLGLAGETAVAVTLIAEIMSTRSRGFGITVVAGFGTFGPVAAVGLSSVLPWRLTYAVAGVAGLAVLLLRTRLRESTLFRRAKQAGVKRGSWRVLLRPRSATTFVLCIASGLPLIYAFSILNFFSFEFGAAALTRDQPFDQKMCLLAFYTAFAIGDVVSGLLSQAFRSRRGTMAVFIVFGAVASTVLLVLGPRIGMTARGLYLTYFAVGLSSGYWVLFNAIAAEHFGTDVRATASVCIVNILRACTIPMTLAFQHLKATHGVTGAAAVIGVLVFVVALLSLARLRETFATDLDYVECQVASPIGRPT